MKTDLKRVDGPMCVACAAEGDYIRHSAAMLSSLLSQSGQAPIRVFYLHDHLADASDLRLLQQMVNAYPAASLTLHEVQDELVEGLPTRGFTGKATWYRIFLPELLPDLDRILCLDVDLLIADSIEPLWRLDMGDSLIAAVTNVLAPMYMRRPSELGLDPRAYFNAGVMLFDLEKMRRADVTERIRSFAVEHADELVLRDQDALNRILASRRMPIHPRWNAMNSLRAYPWSTYVFPPDEIDEALVNPSIRHFEGPGENKPWHAASDEDAQALYRRYRGMSPWPQFALDGAPSGPSNGRMSSKAAAYARAAKRRFRGGDPQS